MSRALSVELSDAAFAALEIRARAAGRSPADLAAGLLEQQFIVPNGGQGLQRPPDEQTKQAARERFERHFGAVNLGQPTGADNESIDADLARAYDNRPEDG